jgi:hypothetical protein
LRLARKLYKENRRINRQLKVDSYRRWFRHVYLGNLARWTWWTDKPRLARELQYLKSGSEEEVTRGMIIKILKENTFLKILDGMHRFRYMECPVALEMLRYKYSKLKVSGGTFLALNTGLLVRRQILEVVVPQLRRTLIMMRVPLKLKLACELSQTEKSILYTYNYLKTLIQ